MDKARVLARYRQPDVQMTIPGTGVQPVSISRCVICSRVIRNPVWVEMGIGPTCAKNHPDIASALMAKRIDTRKANHQGANTSE